MERDFYLTEDRIVFADQIKGKGRMVLAAIFAGPGIIALLVSLFNLLTGFQFDGSVIAPFILGVFFCGFGALIFTMRRRVSLSKNGRTIYTLSGTLGMYSDVPQPIFEPQQVILSRDWNSHQKGNGGYYSYVVRLDSRPLPMELSSNLEYGVSRRQAEAVARYLDKPLLDKTRSEEVAESPEQLDNRVIETLDTVAVPHLPDGSAIQVWRGDNLVTLLLPCRGFDHRLLREVMILTIALILFPAVLDDFITAFGWGLMLPALVILIATRIGPLLVKAYRKPELLISPDALEYRPGKFARNRSMTTSGIENISLDNGLLIISSDDGQLRIALNVTREEREFVRDMVLYAMQFYQH